MPPFPIARDILLAGAMVLAAALGLVIAALAVSGGMLTPHRAHPGRSAIAHWLPLAILGLIATALGHAELAVAAIFGTTVAALSGVSGVILLAGAVDPLPAPAARAWALLPVATTLAFLAGFQGNLGLFEAVVLLMEGLLVVGLWPRRARNIQPDQDAPHPRDAWFRAGQIIAGLGVAGVSAWAAVRGAQQLAGLDPRYSQQVVGATILGAALAMPLLASGLPLAAQGQAWHALTAQIGLVYLNLCLLLPLVILLPLMRAWIVGVGLVSPATHPAFQPVLFPRVAWRIDALAAVILSLIYMAAAGGWLKLDRRIAGGLIFAYVVYLLTVVAASLRI